MNSSRYSLDDSSPSSYHMKPSEDQQHDLSSEKTQPYSSTSLSSHVLTYSIDQDHGSCFPRANNFASEGGSSHDHGLKLCLWKNENGPENRSDLHHDHCQDGSTKWLPSKLRFVRRMMMNSDRTAKEAPAQPQMKFEEYQKQASPISPMEATENSSNSSSSNNNNNPIRVCADCNTTKTPLWRSGPRGPKSLCNACGIRQRKARRAMAAAVAAAANGTTLVAESTTPLKPKVQQKDKKLKINAPLARCKNRSKLGNGRKKQLCFEDFLISLNKNLAFHQVFPQEEKEAAILLMALSCGLVHG